MPKDTKKSHESFFCREELKKDLKRKSVKGGLIKITANGTSAVLSLVSTIVLVRLLMPEEFGLIAMVVSITDFGRYFMELGLGVATVQREKITDDEVSTLFWINVSIGIILMLIVASLSSTLTWFYGESRLSHICMLLSTSFLFRGLTVQHRSLLERQMRFGSLAIITIASYLLGICVAIVMALYGYGYWALVWRELVISATYAAGVWLLCRWIPGFPRINSDIKSSLRFGADLSGNSIVHYITTNLDLVLIGRFFGAASLGFYSKALQLAMMPLEQISSTIFTVGLSPLSSLQNDAERYRLFYKRMLSVLSFTYMPVMLFLAIQSEGVIRLLLGEGWISAAPFLRLLAIAGFIKPILRTCQLIMITCGMSRRYLYWGIMSGLCVIMAYTIGILWGAIGVAFGYAIASYATLVLMLWFGLRDTPVSVILILKTISLPVISSIGAGVILVALLPSIPGTSTLVSLVLSFLVFEASYLGIWLSVPTGRQDIARYWSYSTELFRRD